MRLRVVLATAILLSVGCSGREPAKQSGETQPDTIATRATPVPVAESLYFAGEYDNAEKLWRQELDSASRAQDSLRQATVLMWLGLAAWRQGDNTSARTLGEQSLELKKRLPGNSDISRSYNALGLLARDEGRLRDAAALFEQAVATARQVDDTPGVSRAAANMALVQLEFGEFEKARAGFEAARQAGRATGDARVEGNALNNLAMLTIRLGDPAGAIPLIDSALARYRSIEYTTGEQNSLAQLASAYDMLGDPNRALSLLDSASKIARANDMRAEEASNLRLTGQVYATIADHRRALGFFSRSVAISRELGLRLEEATALRSEAASHLVLGRVDLARARTLEALGLHREEGASWEELGDRLMLAELAAIAGNQDDASASINAARALARRADVPAARAEVALTAARIAARRDDWRSVLNVLGGAVQVDLESARSDIAWEPASLRARAFARLGNLDSAAAAGRQAVAAAERVRSRITSAGLRTGFTSARANIYSDLVLVLLRQGRMDEAFAAADAARGRALVEHLSTAREQIGRAAPVMRDAVRGEELLRQIDELVDLLETTRRTPRPERSLDDREIAGIAARITQAEDEYAGIVERAGAQDRGRAKLLGLARVQVSDVQKVLRADEGLVEYLVAGDRVFVFVLRRNVVRHVEIPIGDSALALRVRLTRELLSQSARRDEAVAAALAGLHQILVAPVEKTGILNGAKRLVVVPHSALSYLPFAALRDSRGRYLAESYAISVLPSAGALSYLRETRADSLRTGLDKGMVFAPFTRDLPATRTEARSVQASLGSARAFYDAAASERIFRESSGINGVLHLATHGTLNIQNPLFSRIELAGSGRSGARESTDDGRLAVHEIIEMRTSAPLVFLSGCETARGTAWSTDFAKGEDYATLSQALLYSGAGGVVATLWRINDASAAVFARHFYRNLRKLPPEEALAAAQQNMLIDARYRAPYFWASYQLAGSGKPIAIKSRWWDRFARL
jgi:CHAT domain-containing protein